MRSKGRVRNQEDRNLLKALGDRRPAAGKRGEEPRAEGQVGLVLLSANQRNGDPLESS